MGTKLVEVDDLHHAEAVVLVSRHYRRKGLSLAAAGKPCSTKRIARGDNVAKKIRIPGVIRVDTLKNPSTKKQDILVKTGKGA
jgi:hypothetical protein